MTLGDNEHYWGTYVDAWNEHDPESVVAAFADGGTYVDPNAGEKLRGQEIVDYVAGTIQGIPDVSFEEHRILGSESDDSLILSVEWTMHGTHTGTLEGLPPTGNTIELDGVDVVTISDDGITAITGYFDQQTFSEQLGLTFPAIIGQLPKLAVGAIKQVV